MLADIPIVPDVITKVLDSTAGWAWDKVTEGIASWVLGAVGDLVDGSLHFLTTAARPNVEAAWFSGAGSPYATVRNLAGLLLLAFVFLAIIQGLMAGDPTAMLRRVATDLPLAVFGMVVTVSVVAKLLELTDVLSAAVLDQSGGQALHFVSGFGATLTGATNGFAAVIVGLVAVFAALMLWIELMVRSVLVYLLVALAPLGFAAMVWPATRGVLRRMVDLLVAVIISKFVVSVALAVGVAALAGAGTAAPANAGVVDASAQGLGALLVGTAILGLAAFSPFLVLRLIPLAEAAVVAHGVSRGPLRAAQSSTSNLYHVQSLGRLAGGSSAGRGGSAAGLSGAASSSAPAGAAGGAAAAAGPVGMVGMVATSTVGGAARSARSKVDAATSPGSGSATTANRSATTGDQRRGETGPGPTGRRNR